ncbi:MAG TPA: hypothetical protein VL400_21880 [Polyangiaceae bacterium]|nr:hypothetical protein [Polyangiaceae bacterium]
MAPAGLKKTARRDRTRRGSPEAIEKRRAARRFNDLLAGEARAAKLDGRTEKKRQRLLKELREGQLRASGKGLKPIDVLLRVDELLALGEPVASLKKALKPPRPVPSSDEVVDGVRQLHVAYGFRAEAYAFVGIDEATLKRAGVGKPATSGKAGAAKRLGLASLGRSGGASRRAA